MTNTYTFQRFQQGYWGQTPLVKTIKVRAQSQLEAEQIVYARKDFLQRLRNGDTQTWKMVDSTE